MRADGAREALQLLMIGRGNTVQSCKTARTVRTSVIVTAPAQLRGAPSPSSGAPGPRLR
jgi:hypothetical protein